ncbi:MAG TPA: hypothetical protein VL096_16330 [Pirellulaceae bacterium]|nr:hypothetical protein [Pirellulaceae bacterium]
MSSEKTKVLIVVMTYPHPSRCYQELVCTAGVTESLEWVRLYPVDYRYRPTHQRFKKYQWIEVELAPRGAGNDNRKESRRPELDSIQLIGEPLTTKHDWQDRRQIVDALPHRTLNEWKALHEQDETSLGIVRPKRVLDMKIRKSKEPDWKPEWNQLFRQQTLFGPPQKPLRKLPYSFHYIFECEDSDKPNTAMCEDWELGALFLKESERLGSDELAARSVRDKFLTELCGPKKDTRFFMGTFFPYNIWLVLGVFWPPRQQPTLFPD